MLDRLRLRRKFEDGYHIVTAFEYAVSEKDEDDVLWLLQMGASPFYHEAYLLLIIRARMYRVFFEYMCQSFASLDPQTRHAIVNFTVSALHASAFQFVDPICITSA